MGTILDITAQEQQSGEESPRGTQLEGLAPLIPEPGGCCDGAESIADEWWMVPELQCLCGAER